MSRRRNFLAALVGALLLMAFPAVLWGPLSPPFGPVLTIFQVLTVVCELAGLGILLTLGVKSAKGMSRVRRAKAKSDAEKALQGVRQEAEGLPLPPAVAAPTTAGTKEEQGVIKSLEEFPIGEKLGWELTRIVVDDPPRRVTIMRGAVAIKADRLGRPPKLLFIRARVDMRNMLYYIDPKRIIKVTTDKGGVSYKLVFDILFSEALKQDGSLEWDEDLEMILADAALDQYVLIAEALPGFHFTPTLRNAMILVGVLGLFMGISLNGTFHFVPTTLIHWVP